MIGARSTAIPLSRITLVTHLAVAALRSRVNLDRFLIRAPIFQSHHPCSSSLHPRRQTRWSSLRLLIAVRASPAGTRGHLRHRDVPTRAFRQLTFRVRVFSTYHPILRRTTMSTTVDLSERQHPSNQPRRQRLSRIQMVQHPVSAIWRHALAQAMKPVLCNLPSTAGIPNGKAPLHLGS